MSRKTLSWRVGRRGGEQPPSPLTMANLERRLRTESDDARHVPSPSFGRRTMARLEALDRGGVAPASPSRRPRLSLATMSLAASLVLAVLIGQVLTTQEPASSPAVITRAVTMPTPQSLQADALASMQSITQRTGLELDREALAEPLLTEVRALWRDASSAANSMLISVPSRVIKPDRTEQSG